MTKGGEWTYTTQFYPDEDIKRPPICTSISYFFVILEDIFNPKKNILCVQNPIEQMANYFVHHIPFIHCFQNIILVVVYGKGIIIRRSK